MKIIMKVVFKQYSAENKKQELLSQWNDKIISNLGYGSRKEIKQLARKGLIEVDGEIIKDSGFSVDPEKSVIKVNGEEIFYRKYIYLMMNKPDGVVSATFDNRN